MQLYIYKKEIGKRFKNMRATNDPAFICLVSLGYESWHFGLIILLEYCISLKKDYIYIEKCYILKHVKSEKCLLHGK